LALGIAMVDGEEMVAMTKGKAINTLHWVGDDLWNLES
jgi:PUA domain protein